MEKSILKLHIFDIFFMECLTTPRKNTKILKWLKSQKFDYNVKFTEQNILISVIFVHYLGVHI